MKITSIKKGRPRFTLDVEVANTHSYQLKNGSVVHNTSSLVLGTPSGIHAGEYHFYKRNIRVNDNEAIATHMRIHYPELIAPEVGKEGRSSVISIPQKLKSTIITKEEEGPLSFLERIKDFNIKWIRPGYRKGHNHHNISATVSYKESQIEDIRKWMFNNRDFYNGLSLYPLDENVYTQPPFERISDVEYYRLISHLSENFTLENMIEYENNTDLNSELACHSGACEVVSL